MTSFERVLAALDNKIPDRVPFSELYINSRFIKEHFKTLSYSDFLDLSGLDLVMVPSSKKTFRKLSKDTYKDSWNTIYKDTGEEALIEYICPISNKDDLIKYKPPDPANDPRLLELEKTVHQFKNKKAIVFPVSDAFSRPRTLLGLENLLIGFLSDPDLIHTLVHMSIGYYEKLIKKAVVLGADIIISADDYAGNTGPLMAPAHFAQFILPGLRRLVKRTHELGARYIKHTDGNITQLLDMLVSSGIDGLHPIEERAGMDIVKVKKDYGNKICIIGSVDCRQTLCSASGEDVTAEVKGQISKLAPGGGYMVASSNSIHSGVDVNNFMSMARAVKEFGSYPIRV